MKVHIDLKPQSSSIYPKGLLVWDQRTGDLSGDAVVAGAVRAMAAERAASGSIPAIPPGGASTPVSLPLVNPAALAALLAFMQYEVPAEFGAVLRKEKREIPDEEGRISTKIG